jgi:hypothetical protein
MSTLSALRMARHLCSVPWDASEEQRRRTVERVVVLVETAEPLLAIKAAMLLLRMDESNRQAAKLLARLEREFGSPDDADLEDLERQDGGPPWGQRAAS